MHGGMKKGWLGREVQLEKQIRARLERALKATFKTSAFSCVIFVTRINMTRIVFTDQNSGTTGKRVKLSWETSEEPEKVTLMTQW